MGQKKYITGYHKAEKGGNVDCHLSILQDAPLSFHLLDLGIDRGISQLGGSQCYNGLSVKVGQGIAEVLTRTRKVIPRG